MITKMIFTVLSYKDLTPLMELDDFISAIWNNKYYEVGEFEIVCQTTSERLIKILRNNYIALNGTDEIGIIENIQYSKDEDRGAIMTIRGAFSEALLKRRIIWDKKIIGENIAAGIRELITENTLAPVNDDRKLTRDIIRETLYSDSYISIPHFSEINRINILGRGELYSMGTITRGLLTDFAMGVTNIGSGDLVVNVNGELKSLAFNIKNVWSFVKELWGNPLSDKGSDSIIWDKNGCNLYTYNKSIELYSRGGDRNSSSWDDTNLIATTTYPISSFSSLEFEEKNYLSNRLVSLTKEQYVNGGYGVAIYDKVVHIRIGVPRVIYDWFKNLWQGTVEDRIQWEANKSLYMIDLVFNDDTNGKGAVPDAYKIFNRSHWLLLETKEQQKYDLIPENGITDLTVFQEPFELKYTGSYPADLYTTYTLTASPMEDYLALGTSIDLKENNYSLEVYGDNLLDKIAEILKARGAAIRTRYVKKDKKIYFDLYTGSDKTSRIIYSESLDNLYSYEVASANVKANSALVYSELNGTEYKAEAGQDAGYRRFEVFLNKKDTPGYTGTDYLAQLEADGTLTLQGLTLAITAEVDNRAYKYRDADGFNVGDIIEIIITDLNIKQSMRVLEAREFYDETGYTIDIVLGN